VVERAIDIEVGLGHALECQARTVIMRVATLDQLAHMVIALGQPVEARLQLVACMRAVHGTAEVARRFGKRRSIVGRVGRRPIGMNFLVEAMRGTVEPLG